MARKGKSLNASSLSITRYSSSAPSCSSWPSGTGGRGSGIVLPSFLASLPRSSACAGLNTKHIAFRRITLVDDSALVRMSATSISPEICWRFINPIWRDWTKVSARILRCRVRQEQGWLDSSNCTQGLLSIASQTCHFPRSSSPKRALTLNVPVKPSLAAWSSDSVVDMDLSSCLPHLQQTGAPATVIIKPPIDTSLVADGA